MSNKYRFSKHHKDIDTQQIQRELEDNFVSFDKDGNIVLTKDIYCRDIITEASSIYIGSKKPENKLENISNSLYFNSVKIVSGPTTVYEAVLADHASQHEDGGSDEIDHDSLSGYVADEHKSNAYNIAMSVALGMP